MPQSTDYHDWTIPVPHTESDDDKDQWGDILVSVLDDEVDEDVILKDTKANRPDPGVADRWFLAVDETPPGLYLDDGASWITIWDGDADTLDGYDSTDFAALGEAETVTAGWTFGSGLTAAGDVVDDTGVTIYDYTNNWLPIAALEANSVTVAGNTVSLGTSTGVAHADLSSITASDHHSRPTTGAGLTETSGAFEMNVVASGQVSLTSGTAVVDTGLSATDATFQLALGIDDPAADAKVSGRLFWDDSAGTYKVEIVEQETAVDPTVNYDIVRVR